VTDPPKPALPRPDPSTRIDVPASPGPATGLKAQQARAKAKVEQFRADLEATRPRSRTIDVVFSSIEHDTATGGSVLAAAAAFRLFLFMVPYVFALVYGFGLAADAGDKDPKTLAEQAGVAGLLASTIDVAADQSLATRIIVFVGALVAVVLAARSVLKVLAVIHALAWRVPVRRFPRRTRAAGVFILLVTLAIALVQGITWMRDESLVAGLTATILFIAVPTVIWLFVSLRLAHEPDAGWRDLLPGAVLVGVGLQILHLVTVFWIARQLESKSETYGAIGAALAILLWAYIVGRVLAGSAVLNAAIYERKRRVTVVPPAPPGS
jgi:uncharacterized BrkB/YihY/UPF0761 family membrane protein